MFRRKKDAEELSCGFEENKKKYYICGYEETQITDFNI